MLVDWSILNTLKWVSSQRIANIEKLNPYEVKKHLKQRLGVTMGGKEHKIY